MYAARGLLASLLLLGVALTGCIGAGEDLDQASLDPVGTAEDLTQPIYDTLVREEVTFEGHEGTRQWMDIYRPDVEDGTTLPTILVMTPYQALGDALGAALGDCADAGEMPQQCPYDQRLVDFFVPRGYAVAFSDVRGNHNSGGCIDQSGPDQWEDGYATVQHLAEMPWSNGNVGMIGVSYDGETQQTTALMQPPALKTIVPIASVAGQYDYVFFDGVPYEEQGLGTMAGYLAISAVPGQDPGALTSYPERFECQPEAFEAALDTSGDMTEFWLDREYRLHADQVTTSVLHIHGLADWNVKPIHIDGWYNELVNAEEKRAIYGQWGHAWPDRGDWWDQGGILHRWMDHWLLDIDTGLLDELPPVLIEDSTEQWRGIESFPPLEQDTLTLHLTTDGALATEPGAAGELAISDPPREKVAGTAWEATDGTSHEALETATGAPTYLVWESEPFPDGLRLTGVPELLLRAETEGTSTHWAAMLEVVEPNGDVWWSNRGYHDTRHIDGLTEPRDLEPGEAYELALRMFPQDDVIPPGSVLRIELSKQDEWVSQDDTYADSAVFTGENGSVLTLPLAPAGQDYTEEGLVPWTSPTSTEDPGQP